MLIVRARNAWLVRAAGLGIALLGLLSACGGGNSSNSNTPPAAGLTVSQTGLTFNVEQGSAIAAQEVTASVSGVNGTVLISINQTNSGILRTEFAITSNTAGRLQVVPRPWDQLAPGTYNDVITINACLDNACASHIAGSPWRINVSYTVRPAQAPAALELSQRAVAMAQVGSRERLRHVVMVRDNTGAASSWTATTDGSWLTVTASGASGSSLILQASPTAVAELPDGQHMARVTVRSSNAALRDQLLRVGLYKTSTAGAATLAQPTVPNSLLINQVLSVAVDPALPLRYASRADRIMVDHFHSGLRVDTISVPGANLKDMVINDDGTRLYAVDVAARTLVVVDLASRQVIARPPIVGASLIDWGALRIGYVRVGTTPMLVLNSGELDAQSPSTLAPIVEAETGQARGSVVGFSGRSTTVFASSGSEVVYAADAGLSGGGLSTVRIEVKQNSMGRVFGVVRSTPPEPVSTNLVDFAASSDGTQVLNAYYQAALPQRARYEGNVLQWSTLPGGALGNMGMSEANVEFHPDGRFVVIANSSAMRLYGPGDVVLGQWSSGLPAEWRSFEVAGLVKWSSDGLRLMGASTMFNMP